MTDNCVTSTSFLSPVGFKFSIARAPTLNFHVQSANLPGIQLSTVAMPTPFVPIPREGKLEYETLTVTFRVSENLTDYLEIYNWMTSLGAPRDFGQYKTLSDTTRNSPTSTETLLSDVSLTIMTSNYTPNINVKYFDAFPVLLSDLNFLTTEPDVNYVEATANFRYLRHEITVL